MSVSASEQVFEDASLFWFNVHGGLMFMVHADGSWQGCPDKWEGQDYDPIQVEKGRPPVIRGFGFLMHAARVGAVSINLHRTGQPVKPEKSYTASVEEHEDGWTVSDSYGRVLELRVKRGAALWHVSRWP